MMFDFIDGSSGDETLCGLNSAAIDEIRLMPRVLVDVSERSLSSSILGLETGLPFGIAPMGMCGLAWPGADRDLAIEAARRRMPLCVSTASSMTLEQINEIAEGTPGSSFMRINQVILSMNWSIGQPQQIIKY